MSAARPLPDPDEELLAPFWAATRAGRLTVQACTACGRVRWPPRYRCVGCGGDALAWREVAPVGTLFSWVVSHRAFVPGLVQVPPYVVGLVELEGPEPVRFLGNVVGTPPGALVAGDRMVAVFEPVTDAVTLVNWRRQPPTR